MSQGLITFFARHRNAANLLMAIMLIAGAYSLLQLNRQLLPDISTEMILVQVPWPGASPDDVSANVVEAIEAEVRFLDGVEEVSAVAIEGSASIYLEYRHGQDMSKALSDVQAAIGRITTLPEDSENPIISVMENYDQVANLIVSGPFPESSLLNIARRIRDDLLDRGIAKIDIIGAREPEIWVEVSEQKLRALELTLEDISNVIGLSSMDLPSGDIEGTLSRQIRSTGLAENAEEIGKIEVISRASGEKVYLRDIAKITEEYDTDMASILHNGNPAFELQIRRQISEDTITATHIINDYLAEVGPTLPPTLELIQYDIRANLVAERIMLLTKNGLSGLLIVMAILYLFLNGRLAFWVAMGIPISLLGAMTILLLVGMNINMISMLSFLMALGIIVDDAIVVGEHAAARYEQGYSLQDAIEIGSHRMFAPVMAASLTTIAAFTPLLLIGSFVGQIIKPMPVVVIVVVIASLVECFLILPGHLRHAIAANTKKDPAFKRRFNEWFNHFRENRFQRLVTSAYDRRYVTFTSAVAVLIVSFGLLIGGYVPFTFMPSTEQSMLQGNVVFTTGSKREQTETMLAELHRAAYAAEEKLSGGEFDLINVTIGHVGETLSRDAATRLYGDHVGSFRVELIPPEQRDIRNNVFLAAWQKEIQEIPGLETLILEDPSRTGSPKADIDIRLRGVTSEQAKKAALEIQDILRRFDGTGSIDDDLPYGKREIVLEVSPRGLAMGMTTSSVARQVRNSFEGAIAKRFPREDDEVLVRVMLPEAERNSSRLQTMMLRTPSGQEIPLPEVVTIREQPGFARIHRQNGQREVAVFANVDATLSTPGEIIAALPEAGLDEIARRYGLTYEFKGRAEEQAEAFGDFGLGLILALTAIYIILAWVFASYTRPLVVMSIIPFGLIGAAFGHFIMDFNLSMLSIFSLLGLTGILVNDSIILVTTIDEHHKSGLSLREATIKGVVTRLRPVLITSLTTIGGLIPLMFETSTQAQFLIPVAITIVFGLATATFLVLLVVPALMGIIDDVHKWEHRRLGKDVDPKLEDKAAEV